MFEIEIFFFEYGVHRFFENLGIDEFDESDSPPGCLVFVAGPDSAPGGADLLIPLHSFPGEIDLLVIGHDDMGFFADFNQIRPHVYALVF